MTETVWAIHNFEAEADDEISFHIDEPIIVLQKDELYQDGWWEVSNINRKFYIHDSTSTRNSKRKIKKKKLGARARKSKGNALLTILDRINHDGREPYYSASLAPFSLFFSFFYIDYQTCHAEG